MKVLWFTNTPSKYIKQKEGYNGGGWISSLEEVVGSNENIELGICFFYSENNKVQRNGITYYPVNVKKNITSKIKNKLSPFQSDNAEMKALLNVVDDFIPDIIHVFGTEYSFGLLKKYVNIPIVIHLQGIINPYLNSFFPPGVSLFEYFKNLSIKEFYAKYMQYLFFKKGAVREREIFALNEYFAGRTEWDMIVSSTYAATEKFKYFFCGEILRPPFYMSKAWSVERTKTLRITTTISLVEYKGFDLILKTAQLLKFNYQIDFEWNVYGIQDYKFWETKLGIKAMDVNVKLKGIIDAQGLTDSLLNSDVFVHPSYIDNSPNSVCEAQIIGLPVIATNVGGVSSLIKNSENGYLVPANDPYTLAFRIMEVCNNPETARLLGQNARITALKRHDTTTILNQNIDIYTSILKR